MKTYNILLESLLRKGNVFIGTSDYIKTSNNLRNQIILRHDVDTCPQNSLAVALVEYELGIRGTYYFRMVPGSYYEEVIREIAGLGHEIGYHYETMSQVGNRLSVFGNRGIETSDRLLVTGNRFDSMKKEGRLDMAYQLFAENLEKLRKIVPVETICMHGSPLSRFDNREIWKKYDYRELGIIGEASMDIDFSKVAYYTDTGRRWDGASMSVRDKVQTRLRDQETKGRRDEGTKRRKIFPTYHSTFEMIKAVENGMFPEQAMITIHPQRWNDAWIPWTRELVWQNVKNVGKWFIIKMRENK